MREIVLAILPPHTHTHTHIHTHTHTHTCDDPCLEENPVLTSISSSASASDAASTWTRQTDTHIDKTNVTDLPSAVVLPVLSLSRRPGPSPGERERFDDRIITIIGISTNLTLTSSIQVILVTT